MKLKTFLAPVLIALALGLVACGDSGDDSTESGDTAATTTEPSGSTPAPSGEAARSEKVKIVEFVYGPDPVTVQTGGKVIWQNEDTAPHTATADDGSFDTGTIERGKIKSETFKQAGTITYFCEIHPTMHGTVEVVEKD
ncbi:MAG TPA: plastocyanin/azurin family copper-binding protein [Solirubrobacterales bacterium]|nr:plastocyanin/azurin family copper-binding protein [Solirubrobacterales bacterium]